MTSLKKALGIAQQVYGPVSEKGVAIMISLGSACLKLGDYQKAIEYIECAIGQKRQLVLKLTPEQVIRDHLKLCEAYKGL